MLSALYPIRSLKNFLGRFFLLTSSIVLSSAKAADKEYNIYVVTEDAHGYIQEKDHVHFLKQVNGTFPFQKETIKLDDLEWYADGITEIVEGIITKKLKGNYVLKKKPSPLKGDKVSLVLKHYKFIPQKDGRLLYYFPFSYEKNLKNSKIKVVALPKLKAESSKWGREKEEGALFKKKKIFLPDWRTGFLEEIKERYRVACFLLRLEKWDKNFEVFFPFLTEQEEIQKEKAPIKNVTRSYTLLFQKKKDKKVDVSTVDDRVLLKTYYTTKSKAYVLGKELDNLRIPSKNEVTKIESGITILPQGGKPIPERSTENKPPQHEYVISVMNLTETPIRNLTPRQDSITYPTLKEVDWDKIPESPAQSKGSPKELIVPDPKKDDTTEKESDAKKKEEEAKTMKNGEGKSEVSVLKPKEKKKCKDGVSGGASTLACLVITGYGSLLSILWGKSDRKPKKKASSKPKKKPKAPL